MKAPAASQIWSSLKPLDSVTNKYRSLFHKFFTLQHHAVIKHGLAMTCSICFALETSRSRIFFHKRAGRALGTSAKYLTVQQIPHYRVKGSTSCSICYSIIATPFQSHEPIGRRSPTLYQSASQRQGQIRILWDTAPTRRVWLTF